MMESKITLIDCPCCRNKVSNHAVSCPQCGHPLQNYVEEKKQPKRRCVNCGHENSLDAKQCARCRKVFDFGGCVTIAPVEDNRNLFVPKKELRCCPQCGGTRYHAFVEEQVLVPAKVKSKTTLNMNPLKPFTVFNHKEKVVREAITRQVSKFVCDDCGKIFQ